MLGNGLLYRKLHTALLFLSSVLQGRGFHFIVFNYWQVNWRTLALTELVEQRVQSTEKSDSLYQPGSLVLQAQLLNNRLDC